MHFFSFLFPIFVAYGMLDSRNYSSQHTSNFNLELKKYLCGKSLVGTWKLTQQKNFLMSDQQMIIKKYGLSFFQNGTAKQIQGFFDEQFLYEKQPTSNLIYLKLFNEDQQIERTGIVQINLQNLVQLSKRQGKNINLWSTKKQQPTLITFTLRQKQDFLVKYDISADVQIFTNTTDIAGNLAIFIEFESETFKFSATLQEIKGEYNLSILFYNILAIVFFGLVMLSKQSQTVFNISEWFILHIFSYIFFSTAMINILALKYIDTNLKYLVIGALANIIVALIFLRKYQAVLWSLNTTRKRIMAIFYFLLFFNFSFTFNHYFLFLIVQSFGFYLLQIYHSYNVGGKGGIGWGLIATILVARLQYFYVLFTFENLTKIQVSDKNAMTFIFINILLSSVIIFQRLLGSRFFIPKDFIKEHFDYFVNIEFASQILSEDCAICHGSLKDQSQMQTQQKVNTTTTKTDFDVTLMKTPCNHYYHSECLSQWMNKRLNCPMCREEIPASSEQKDESYYC